MIIVFTVVIEVCIYFVLKLKLQYWIKNFTSLNRWTLRSLTCNLILILAFKEIFRWRAQNNLADKWVDGISSYASEPKKISHPVINWILTPLTLMYTHCTWFIQCYIFTREMSWDAVYMRGTWHGIFPSLRLRPSVICHKSSCEKPSRMESEKCLRSKIHCK